MIQTEEVLAAQNAWKEFIMALSPLKDDRAALEAKAKEFFRTLYNNDELSFKPTRAAKIPFRNSEAGFVSYFIGGNPDYPEDTGFALVGFRDIRFDNTAIILKDDIAIAGGVYYFQPNDGDMAVMEYTIMYEKSGDGLRIAAHHSSKPYSA